LIKIKLSEKFISVNFKLNNLMHMKKLSLFILFSVLGVSLNAQLTDSIIDPRDGQVYKIVQIGDQIWMAENLKYLPSVVLSSNGSTTIPYYYVLDYEGTDVNAAKATANYATYGVLYNWPAAMNNASSSESNPSMVQGVCTDGWHLPSDAEWKQLIDYLGGIQYAGGKLKETETAHWNYPNTGATNETGFNALPGGYRYYGGTYEGHGYYGYWWSATETAIDRAMYRGLSYNFGAVIELWDGKELGYSVRCIKDTGSTSNSLIKYIRQDNQINIHPNPFSDQTTIKFNNPERSQYILYIIDLSGKMCRIIDGINTSEYVIAKGNLKEGFYFIELKGPKIFRGKIIIK
jgi:uncharacterized protein (TIGR02145 family)